jgi:hypothetical protein
LEAQEQEMAALVLVLARLADAQSELNLVDLVV